MSDVREMTAVQAGLSSERQIQIALQAIDSLGGQATTEQIYAAITQELPLGIALSQQGRDTLRSLISRDAVERGYIEPYNPDRPGWRIAPDGHEYLRAAQESLGVEAENTFPVDIEPPQPTTSEDQTVRPFDPKLIRVDQRMMSIFQVMLKIQRHDIDLQPDFQRNVVWDPTRQSRLIESILLRIPLPAFYLDATAEDKWLVVDGLQRLTTLKRFYFDNKDLPEGELPLVLTNLEFLDDLEGKQFKQLPRNLQRLIEDTELNLYVIRPETPPEVKFTIFSRVNTGGLVLTPQEIRHALFQGWATHFLEELTRLPEFLSATTGSISSRRMDDRECALRFLAFHMTDYTLYGRREQRDKSGRIIKQSLDGFLSEAMEQINALGKAGNEDRLAELREAFRQAMLNAEAIFGPYAFRKMYKRGTKRTQISKPLFEVWSALLQQYDRSALESKREAIIDGFIALMNDSDFNKAVSLGTGSIWSVHTRFERVAVLLEEVVG
ncbi:DUF262 domain-containing protein [Chloroflexales bacterium ZM16-3]|nr:DUF262 domain-containing protein [Chloroflexales bacterium ZM16-3]